MKRLRYLRSRIGGTLTSRSVPGRGGLAEINLHTKTIINEMQAIISVQIAYLGRLVYTHAEEEIW
jgi:hypothetical protein